MDNLEYQKNGKDGKNFEKKENLPIFEKKENPPIFEKKDNPSLFEYKQSELFDASAAEV